MSDGLLSKNTLLFGRVIYAVYHFDYEQVI
jgi:hypothetical protein